MYCLVQTPAGREALELFELQDPASNNKEVPVRVHTAGVNYVDIYYRKRKYKTPLPFIPGIEGAGHVKALGEGPLQPSTWSIVKIFETGRLV